MDQNVRISGGTQPTTSQQPVQVSVESTKGGRTYISRQASDNPSVRKNIYSPKEVSSARMEKILSEWTGKHPDQVGKIYRLLRTIPSEGEKTSEEQAAENEQFEAGISRLEKRGAQSLQLRNALIEHGVPQWKADDIAKMWLKGWRGTLGGEKEHGISGLVVREDPKSGDKFAELTIERTTVRADGISTREERIQISSDGQIVDLK